MIDEKADRARQLLEDTLLNEAFDVIESKCIEQWRATLADDLVGRERAWHMMQSARAVKTQIRSYVDGQKLKGKDITQPDKGWF